jgi:hypothetical protein
VSKRLPHGLLGIVDTASWLHGQAAIGSNLNIRSSGHVEIEESDSAATTHRRCAGQKREREDVQSRLMEREAKIKRKWENPSI